jgi:hypothetical protein
MLSRNIYQKEASCRSCHASFNYIEEILIRKQGTVDYKIRNHPKKIAAFASLASLPSAGGASRVKDVAAFEGVRDNQLVGYGLVVGLNGTGDRSQTFFSTQTLANILERSGISISPERG